MGNAYHIHRRKQNRRASASFARATLQVESEDAMCDWPHRHREPRWARRAARRNGRVGRTRHVAADAGAGRWSCNVRPSPASPSSPAWSQEGRPVARRSARFGHPGSAPRGRGARSRPMTRGVLPGCRGVELPLGLGRVRAIAQGRKRGPPGDAVATACAGVVVAPEPREGPSRRSASGRPCRNENGLRQGGRLVTAVV